MTLAYKVRLAPRSIVRAKVDARFPASVNAQSPIIITQANGGYTFALDVVALGGMLPPPSVDTIHDTVINLVEGSPVNVNAALGTIFDLTATADRTIAVPTNPPAAGQSQKIVLRILASGANRNITLTTGAGGFRFGSLVTGLTPIISGKQDYIGAIWNGPASRWDVVSYSKGY